ncbi:MAG: GGDEF domain-containing protein [Immundisolibacteraceae bacterium]|nr:GGDEF domain-containing protein [Immundisolibacteraceae bacterium]
MRYPDSVAQCGEFLRLAIPFLSQHKLPAHPINYALSFEIVSATNPTLGAAFDELNSKGIALNAAQSQQLFHTHVAQPDAEQVSQLTTEVSGLISESRNLLGAMANESDKYQDSLEREGPKLQRCSSTNDLQKIINTLMADTKSMRETNATINLSLTEHVLQIGELRNQLKASRAAATVDALTGLLNRGAFDEQLIQAIDDTRAAAQPLSLIMVDIDHFKKINDAMGHLVGDKVIKAVGQAIRKQTRGQDTSARIGGEEFAIILSNTSTTGAEVVAENIRKAVEKIVLRKTNQTEKITTVTLSGGIALLLDSDDPESLYDRADSELYVAKNEGRNQIYFSKVA